MTKEGFEQIKRGLIMSLCDQPIATDRLNRLLSEVERLQAEREWRPIETARDDTWCIVGWATGKDVSKGIKRLNVWRSVNGAPYFNPPTHWMPLPDSPEGGKE